MSQAKIPQTLSEARTFLEALFAGKPEELHILIWTLPNKTSRWFREVESAATYVESLSGSDVYVGVGLSPDDLGESNRCKSEKVAGIVALWADIDLLSDAHSDARRKVARPARVEDALSILPAQLPPSFVIQSGNGVHVWWLFREPLIFDSDEEHAETARFVNRWQTLLRLNAASRGWAFDRLGDLARILRIPGTTNNKDPEHPKPVVIHSQTDRRYNPGDLAEYLDDQGIPDAEDEKRTAQAWAENLADVPLSIDPSASVPAELLDRYMATDPRFKSTWLRQRQDLKDQSQSGYDLALANFGFEAGLSEQQAVDLIIHHRRIHGQRPRTRVDYFQRTIGKAFARAAGPNPIGLSTVQPGPGVAGLEDEPREERREAQADRATARALVCEQISHLLGVRILRILKITGKEPTYQVELDDGKVEFSNVGKLVDQKSFRMAIAGAANRLIPKIKPKPWEQITQSMLDALTIADGGEETDLAGSMRIYLDHYLSETPFIDSIESEPIQTRRKPTVIDGQIALCAIDLQQYINKTFGESHTIKTITSMLTALEASSTRVKGTRLRDQSRWLLPRSEFAPDEYIERGEEGTDARGY